MKGLSNYILIFVVAAVLIGSAYYMSGNDMGFQAINWEGCTWQPDYCYASCVIDEAGSTEHYVNAYDAFMCPNGADVHQCQIISPVSCGDAFLPCQSQPYITQTCTLGWLGYSCSGTIKQAQQNTIFERGQWLWTGASNNQVVVKVIRKQLQRCGTAGCVGGGAPIFGAQGCSWNPGTQNYVWDDGTTGAKSIPVGQGYPYVCSQHLVSCPSTCTDPMICSVPQNLKNFVIQYQGKSHKAYVTCVGQECTTQVIGCKTQTYDNVCIERDYATGECLEYGSQEYGECGTIAQLPAGSCALDNDCGPSGTYYCDWDSSTNTGECKPWHTHECDYDYDCDQTGVGCLDYQVSTVRCVQNTCKKETQAVDCCTSSDCAPGYYCDVNRECKLSQVDPADCPYACCDQTYNANDAIFKQKPCPSTESVCCGDHTCAATIQACSLPPRPSPQFEWIWIILGVLLGGLIAYLIGDSLIAAAIGAIVGGIGGWLLTGFLGMAWWQQLLLVLGVGAGGALLVYAMILMIPVILAMLILVMKR